MLTAERVRELLTYDPETGLFTHRVGRSWVKAGDPVGRRLHHGYAIISVDNKQYGAHRLAWLYMTGSWPKHQIDHKNLIKHDNRWKNLREATRSQNNANRRSYALSGKKGVYLSKSTGKWYIMVRGYASKEQAAEAFLEAATKLWGEFVRPE